MKIRTKINLSFLTTFVLVTSSVGLAVGIYTTDLVKNNIYSYLHSSSRARAEHIRTFLQDQKDSTKILAGTLSVENYLKLNNTDAEYSNDRDALGECFGKIIENNPNIYKIFVLDIHGKIVLTTFESQLGEDKSGDSYFIGGKSDTYIKDIYYSETLKKINYTISSPVRDDETGNVLGVLVVQYNPKNFYSTVQVENGLGKTEENFFVNKDKFFITPSRFLGEGVILKQKVETENVNECFDPEEIEYVSKNGYGGAEESMGHGIVEAKDYRNTDTIATHAYIPETGWCLVTKVDKSDALSFRRTLIIILLSIFTGGGLIYLLIAFLISKKITNPIKSLTAGVQKVEKGDFDYKINIKTKDEIGQLSRSFDIMTAAVKKSRAEVDRKVAEQTQEIQKKAEDLKERQGAILNILEDIEGEKEKALTEKAKDEALLESIGDGVVATDKDGGILFINGAAIEMLDLEKVDYVGKVLVYYLKMTDESGEEVDRSLRPLTIATKEKKKVSSREFNYQRKNGTSFSVALTVTPIITKDKLVGTIEVFRDIAKEKEVDKAKTEFVSLASHQLRTPLTAINWYSEMLLSEDAGKLTEEQKNFLGEIYAGNQRMVELVNALLNVSWIEMGTLAIDPEPTDFAEIAKSVVAELKSEIVAKKLEMVEDYDASLPKVNADPKLVRIVFQNFLTNAVKYTPEGGKIGVAVRKEGEEVLIKVSDTGYGIPKNQQARIFEKLFRADNVREKDASGTGLGLYLVKSIVENSGGGVWFESEENEGTTFFVALPLSGMKKKEGSKTLSA